MVLTYRRTVPAHVLFSQSVFSLHYSEHGKTPARCFWNQEKPEKKKWNKKALWGFLLCVISVQIIHREEMVFQDDYPQLHANGITFWDDVSKMKNVGRCYR